MGRDIALWLFLVANKVSLPVWSCSCREYFKKDSSGPGFEPVSQAPEAHVLSGWFSLSRLDYLAQYPLSRKISVGYRI